MSTRHPSVSVVIPLVHARGDVERSLHSLQATLEPITEAYELVVVAGGSSGRTGDRAMALAEDDARIKVIRHARKRSLGGTLRTGFSAASCDLVLYTQLDLPFELRDIAAALDVFRDEAADVLAAWRVNRSDGGLGRWASSAAYDGVIRRLFGLELRDLNFAFKLIRNTLLSRLQLRAEGAFIDAELLLQAQRQGARIVQFGTLCRPRDRDGLTLASPRVLGQLTGELLAHRLGIGGRGGGSVK